MKKICIALLLLFAVAPLTTHAETKDQTTHIEPFSKIYIEPMEGFETYLSAAIIKKKVPLVVTDDRNKADYIVTGNSHIERASWAKTIFVSAAPQGSASVAIKDAKTGDLVFAYAVDKFNARKADQSTAEACAKHIKEFMKK